MGNVRWFFSAVYDFLFPPLPVCAFCGARKETAEAECEACRPQWQELKIPGTQRGHYACYYYDGVVKRAVWQYKYSRREDLSEWIGGEIAAMLDSQNVRADAVSYVPLHPSKRKKRGFDQSGRLAQEVADRMGVCAVRALRRVKRTKTQAKLSAAIRKQNVKDAFKCELGTKIDSKSVIILVDDVYTTGATMDSAARAIKAAGYPNVIPVAFASSMANQRPK